MSPFKLLALLLFTAAARPSQIPRVERPTARDPTLRDYGNTNIWPLPASAVGAGCGATLDPATFTITAADPPGDPFLAELGRRFLPIILWYPNGTASQNARLRNLTLHVADPSVRVVQQGVDESYSLTFARDCSSAAITAATIFGARHGLETFAQLVGNGRPDGLYFIGALNVTDAPRFPFRGPLLDVARHWYPPNALLNFMDGLAIHKQNVLMLGVGIDQAFVVETNLTNVTAGFGAPGTHVYSRDTVKFLVAEANYRGIRLLPYIELVGHDPLNLPSLQVCNGKAGPGLFHPLHDDVWTFFDSFWADLRELFLEDYVQLGGDEADISCWKNDTEIMAWNVAHGRPAEDLVFIYSLYMNRMMDSMAKVGFLPMWYADVFPPLNATGTDFAGKKVIFDGWSEDTPGSLGAHLKSGAKVIVTSYCFLVPSQTCPGFNVNGLVGEPNWDYNYRCELQNHSLYAPDVIPFLGNMLGGGPARWGEDTDPTNVWQFTYPAQMGASEKLWSPAALTNGSFYGTRQEVFADHRCYLIRRGVPVQPTSAYSWSCEFEWEPPMPPLTPRNPNPQHSSWAPPAALPAGVTAEGERAARARAELPRARAAGAAEDLMSIWPYPAATTPVPCGGDPSPPWALVCTDCAAGMDESGDCRYLAHGDGSGLEGCQASCVGMGGCNVINWSPTTYDCVLRACENPAAVPTVPFPGYNVYAAPKVAMQVGIDPQRFQVVLDATVEGDPWMHTVVARAMERILWHPWGTFDRPIALVTLTISVADTSVRQIQAGVDEGYNLTFSPSCTAAQLTAQTIFGARHGLETFSQMVQAERLTGSYSVGSYFGVFNISDAPSFDTRGLMVDSSRHYLNPNVLVSLMDALSYVKMNKLEVGFGIDWSYSIQSNVFPNLTGCYGPGKTHTFSRDTLAWLVQEANYRGVRLVPFVELVGHNPLCGKLPQLCWCGGKPKGNLFHPLHSEVYTFLDEYFADLKSVFPETYINVGGDEVDTSCFRGDPEIMAWNTARGYAANDTHHVIGVFYDGLTRAANKNGFKPVFYAEAWSSLNSTGFSQWQNVLYDGWDTQTPGSMATLLEAGAQGIVSSYCFLAPTQGCPDNLPNGGTPDQWTNRNCRITDPSKFPPTTLPFLKNMHGGHPARWGEATDGTNVYQFTWPALMGAAEVLWSPTAVTANASISRALAWRVARCTMVRRGVPVDPRSGGGNNCDWEYEPAYPPRTPRAPNVNSSWTNSSF